jgi:2-phospho-L-lactate guanylyltransferase
VDGLRWTMVVPVKDATIGKSRLAGALADDRRAALVRSMALDTIAAALAAAPVALVVVVSGDQELDGTLAGWPGVVLLAEPGGRTVSAGLNVAVLAGIDEARQSSRGAGIAVLLADLPMLTPGELSAALAAAAGHERAMVADVAGTGTTLLTAGPGIPVVPAFGLGSAGAHQALGHALLEVPAGSGLRRDVDLPGDLAALRTGSPGRWTSAVLG